MPPWYKRRYVCIMSALAWGLLYGPTPSSAVAIGTTRAELVDLLGRPHATIIMEDREVMFYPEGRVVVEEGVVVEADVLSPEELREQQARHEAATRERDAARRAAALAVKEAKLSDPLFLNGPAEQQLIFWEQFRVEHPDISVDGAYNLALQKALQQQTEALRQAAQERHLEELETRLLLAETRAAARPTRTDAPAQVVNVIVNPTPPAPVIVQPEPTQVVCAGPGWVSTGRRAQFGPAQASRRTTAAALRARGRILGNRHLDRSTPLAGPRIGQASSVFRPPLPPAPIRPAAFARFW